MNSKAYSGTQSVLRAIALLKSFSDDRPEWVLAELAAETGLNRTTTFRLLTALESEGLVTRSPVNGAYRLGPEIIALGGLALRSNDLRSASLAELQQLAQQTGEAATLEVLAGSDVLILEEVPSIRLVSSSQSVGTRHPAYATSTGKVLLSDLEPEARRALLPARLVRVTENTITSLAALERELEQVRARGYAVAVEELEPAYVAVSAPVRNHDGRVVAAVCIGGPASRLKVADLPDLAVPLKEAAQRISLQLGYRQPTKP